LDYQALVQPVLAKHCVQCHQPGATDPKFDLTPAKSYQALANYGTPSLKTHVVTYHRQGRSAPGTGPSRESALLRLLRAGHHDVSLNADDWNRLVTWMDTYGQQLGSFSPAQEQQLIQLRQNLAAVLAP
jgi:mono/diheme cytochrome c family protein